MLALIPFYCGARTALLPPLASELESCFGLRVEQTAPAFDPERCYDASRGQFNSRTLLGLLLEHHPGPEKLLAVTDVDLFIPVLTFVFGEAQLGGRAAIVSSHRLAPERYGLQPDLALLRTRLVREAIHELGHTFALVHCRDTRCVMASSPQVEGIDLKSSRFCQRCRARLSTALKGNGSVFRRSARR
jgi:archaemetzincin